MLLDGTIQCGRAREEIPVRASCVETPETPVLQFAFRYLEPHGPIV